VAVLAAKGLALNPDFLFNIQVPHVQDFNMRESWAYSGFRSGAENRQRVRRRIEHVNKFPFTNPALPRQVV
jgi:hypothetical protein